MSYRSKRAKKRPFNQIKFRLGLAKIALLKMKPRKPRSEPVLKEALMFDKEKALVVLQNSDRLKDNPDVPFLGKTVEREFEENGFLRLCVFACPKFKPKAIFSKRPEEYMPIESGPDLFQPRIQKIVLLQRALAQAGLMTEVNVLIGDNDAEEYIFPLINTLDLDKEEYRNRQRAYRQSFEERCRKSFGTRAAVWSLAEMGVRRDETRAVVISEAALEKEMEFLKWLFSAAGPYGGMLEFSDEVLQEMSRQKYQLYGAQGWFLEMLGGVLLQTEGPGVWLERTLMLRSTGAKAMPAIYPWIRREETNFAL